MLFVNEVQLHIPYMRCVTSAWHSPARWSASRLIRPAIGASRTSVSTPASLTQSMLGGF